VLDIGSLVCRTCGEDNALSDSNAPIEVDVEGLDRLKPWSLIKHEIIEKYAHAYTTILRSQRWARRYVYIDAFAGAGVAFDATSDELVPAGALRVLDVEPPFSEYHFIESNPQKAAVLRQIVAKQPRTAKVYEEDYREKLPSLLERCRYEDRARGLCLLDPYGLTVDYDLLEQIAATQTVEIFFNFMLVSANRNVLWRIDPSKIAPKRAAMMRRVWGNDEWPAAAYEKEASLFGDISVKASNDRIIGAYRQRLSEAGFAYVAAPIPMRNSTNAAIYYLFFCSPKAVAADIVEDIFSRYRH
jgi:three-Cys-motif partner protein